ncbi:nicotinate-nucleotide pyrophosphorylase [carboxylating] [Raineyella antarctica]|uniref:Nicotinate-nucleotide pyrophosphorylase [carboxylating] n=1 Tax=Raineyella antarctica TaxID=1577474 RepID=A0A1G6GDK0_9ACTN|nr:carboxylating nicotinate-nucleotide diphosphorylase [Raineyella antarctica]SDB80082.1 nicotinate-nucleotide pyrophosphorylase [carboxylating] [Raineyella antarctica]
MTSTTTSPDTAGTGTVLPWPEETTRALEAAGLDPLHVAEVADRTLAEDLQWGPDVTSEATLPAEATGTADVVVRRPGCLAGVPVAAAVLYTLAAAQGVDLTVQTVAADGDRVGTGDVVLTATGPLRTLLTAERSMLNILCQLSGVATATAAWADALAGTPTRVRDTRKTVPGLRVLQKYAVRCGGGVNHRMGLGDAALVKDNHVAAAGSVAAAFRAVREYAPQTAVEVECDTLAQVAEAIEAGADLVLLDNMDADTVSEAVALTRPAGVRTEASGGLTLADAPAYGRTGVDYISVGALTHSAPVLDLAFDLRA